MDLPDIFHTVQLKTAKQQRERALVSRRKTSSLARIVLSDIYERPRVGCPSSFRAKQYNAENPALKPSWSANA